MEPTFPRPTHRRYHKLFIEQEYSASAGALLASKRLDTIVAPGQGQAWNVEWPHVAFHGASVEPVSFETDKERFLGRYGSKARPAALLQARLSSTAGKWADAIGSLHVQALLRPRQEKEVFFTLGIADTRQEALQLARRYRTSAAVERAWEATRTHWDSLLAPLEVQTPDAAFDVMSNVWLKYQAISGRIRGRSGYTTSRGAPSASATSCKTRKSSCRSIRNRRGGRS
jgi:cellobiose phosphorylase